MRRLWLIPLVALALAAFVAGGLAVAALEGGPHHHGAVLKRVPPSGRALARPSGCYVPPGQGHMGVCVVAPQHEALRPLLARPRPPAASSRRYYGADVSNYQGCVDPVGVSFLYIRIGEGALSMDPYARCTAAHARARHVPFGYYWFARTQYAATYQADRFAAFERSAGKGTLPGALDFETNDGRLSGQAECDFARTFNARYRAAAKFRVNVTYDAPGLWPGCSTIPYSVGWVADLSHGCTARLSGLVNWLCQYSFHGPFGGDADVWVHGAPSSLVRLANGPVYVVPAEAEHQCRMHRKYAAIYVKYREREREQKGSGPDGALGPYGLARLNDAREHLRYERHYFTKNHDHGHTNYDCYSDGHVRVRVL